MNTMRKSVCCRSRRAGSTRRPKPAWGSAVRWGLYAFSGQRKYLNGDERERFIAAANGLSTPTVRTMCLTLVYTGCRVSEVLSLCAADIAVGGGSIAVRSLKKRGDLVVREIRVPPALLAELTDVHGLTIADESGPERRLWPWGRTRAWQHVKAVMTEARIYRLPASPKGLRHGFGVHALRSGVPLHLIQRWMGHEDIATTAIYLDVLGPEEQEIAARMW